MIPIWLLRLLSVTFEISIPSIGASFSNKNFYSRQEGQIDLDDVDGIAEQGQEIMKRIREMKKKVHSDDLDKAEQKASAAANLDSTPNCDAEDVQKANNELLEAKKIISKVRKDNLKEIRQMDLDACKSYVESDVKKYASPAEQQDLDNMIQSAQKSIDRNDNDFDNIMHNLWRKIGRILIKQDWFIVDWYRRLVSAPHNFVDQAKFKQLKLRGDAALAKDDIDTLRDVIDALRDIRIRDDDGSSMFDAANIVKG